ncbi:MAG: hypothetical protein A2086_06705 [Spirochaetes bacterium GWD1_27_9]|nr:MAG: hypothetical protein A2Y34_08115 [Spirochaetes bacterium GWC1_27_15]OHD41329.1 MAG: hypothetical protein A2086_06705 [Spirochaetes bacterium GWD1_27_9]
MDRIGLFLQVRLNSSRLPAKALINLCGKPLIVRTMDQMKKVECDVRVLVTTKECEPYLKNLAKQCGFEIFCGDSQNVLKRFVDASKFFNVDTIIRATGDNPLLSPEIAIETLDLFSKTKADICHLSNVCYGSGVEVVKTESLVHALKKATTPYHFEHVTPYIYENRNKFNIVIHDPQNQAIARPDVKISVDTNEDLERVNYLLRKIIKNNDDFGIYSLIKNYDKLKLNKFKRILFITNNQYLNKCLNIAYKLEEDFNIYFSLKDKKEFQSNFNYLDYDKLENFVDTEGIFDRIIIFADNLAKKDLDLYKKFGFFITINDYGYGVKESQCTINTQKYNNFFNFVGIDIEDPKIIDLIKNFKGFSSICPYCSDYDTKILYRNENLNILYCKKCGLYYSTPFRDFTDIYVDKYFTEEYKEQYGKTYQEDRENIRNFGMRRLKNIQKYIKTGKLLDFGAGMGFFSELCQENGFDTTSIDISNYATDFIREKLKLKAITDDQKYFERTEEIFDVISSFFVIEHIKDFEKLIFLFYCHLSKNGVLALSTPNATGVSVKYNFNSYAKIHPKDHYRIFSPKFLKKVLKKIGFKKIRVVVTGHHPERIIKSKKLITNKIIFKIVNLYSKIFGLGDTFEIYAQKR